MGILISRCERGPQAGFLLAADGYYLAKLRGIKFEVFCVMSEAGDALTYIDVDAWTEFNSGPTQQARMIFEKVRLIADNCIMVLDSNDYRFANQIVSAGSTSDEDVQTNGTILNTYNCGFSLDYIFNSDVVGILFVWS